MLLERRLQNLGWINLCNQMVQLFNCQFPDPTFPSSIGEECVRLKLPAFEFDIAIRIRIINSDFDTFPHDFIIC